MNENSDELVNDERLCEQCRQQRALILCGPTAARFAVFAVKRKALTAKDAKEDRKGTQKN
jgi:hypothetical protein